MSHFGGEWKLLFLIFRNFVLCHILMFWINVLPLVISLTCHELDICLEKVHRSRMQMSLKLTKDQTCKNNPLKWKQREENRHKWWLIARFQDSFQQHSIISYKGKSRKPLNVVLWYWSSQISPPNCTETTSPTSNCNTTPLATLSSGSSAVVPLSPLATMKSSFFTSLINVALSVCATWPVKLK